MKFSEQNGKKSGKNQSNLNLDKNTEKMLKSFVSNYEGLNENELIEKIVATATQNKKQGKLSNSDLDNFSNMLMPMLDEKKQKTLTQIINKLKSI